MLAAMGCASSSNDDAVAKLLQVGIVCAVGQCSPSPRTYVVLRGRVLVPGRFGPAPLGQMRVVLVRDGVPVASAATDRAGRFQFNQDIADGLYDLVLDSTSHQGTTAVLLEGRARTVDLFVLPKPS
jgi:hypothetical protein